MEHGGVVGDGDGDGIWWYVGDGMEHGGVGDGMEHGDVWVMEQVCG